MLLSVRSGEARCRLREKLERILQFCESHSLLGENMAHHAQSLRGSPGVQHKTQGGGRVSVGKCLYCGFSGKERARQDKQA